MTKLKINRFYDINNCINKIMFPVSSLYNLKKKKVSHTIGYLN